MQWCHWQCHQHHMTPVPEPMVLHDQKGHVAPHFSCVKLRNAVVPLMILLVSCNSNASTSRTKWLKYHIASYFDCLDVRSAMVPFLIPLASYDADISANGITWPKSHVAHHFDCLHLINAVVPFTVPLASCDTNTDASGMTRTRKLCCTSFFIILSLQMQSSHWQCHQHHMMPGPNASYD